MELRQMKEKKKHMTLEEFEQLPENVKAEFDGETVTFFSAPSTYHQEISANLERAFYEYLKELPCKIFAAVQVKLFKNKNKFRIPDLLILCEKKKMSKNQIIGAPELIIEIVSPESIKRDYIEKLAEYNQAGVKEYWIVDPLSKKVTLYNLETTENFLMIFEEDMTLHSLIFGEFSISLVDIFAEKLW
ncbi:MAG: Uma2 family endonuclease [Streptococcaceae bacterium]|nr:Uma2 family endonuclease [Streptococcaceae bacterium]